MSRKTSSVYESSSFDAVESTRRLSEEMNNDVGWRQRENVSNGPFSQNSGLNGCTDAHLDKETVGRIDVIIDEVARVNEMNKDVGNREKDKQRLSRQTVKEEDDEIEGERISQGPREHERKASSYGASNGESSTADLEGKTSPRKRAKGDMFEQRSVSDSDLESPDDFSDGESSLKSDEIRNNKEATVDRRDSKGSTKEKQSGSSLTPKINEDQSTPTTDNQRAALETVKVSSSSSETTRIGNGTIADSPAPKTSADVQASSEAMTKTERDRSDKHRDHIASEQQQQQKAGYAQLSVEDIDSKLKDDEVVRQGELLDTVREVGINNLNKLQHLNWNDPALRRLFMRPKISPAEAKSVKVDPDIKNTVNEFLKTNVAENFVISRVLRENYALFYSWLASHLQTERNAWTTRFAQALDQADQERKTSLQCRNLVVETGARLRTLVRTSSNILFGIPGKEDEMFFKTETFRRQGKRGRKNNIIAKAPVRSSGKNTRSSCDFQSTDAGYASEGNGTRRGGGFTGFNAKASRDQKMDLSPSKYRLVDVNKTIEKPNYDSDPGGSSYRMPVMADAAKQSDGSLISTNKLAGGGSKALNVKHTNVQNQNSPGTSTHNGHIEEGGYDLDGLILEDDNMADWNQVLSDNIDVLTDIIDTLLVDRRSCLQILKANPNRCENLVDAVSAFVKNRSPNDTNSQRDVEKRLRALEKENRTLQDEMSVLQQTLADKNRDALNLQSQLDRLETMVKSYSAPKLHKCVGTSEEMFPAVFKNNLTVGGSKTPRQSNQNSPLPKLTKSPRCVDKECKSKKLELPNVNGVSNVKHPRQKQHNQNASGATKDQEKATLDANEQPALNGPTDLSPPEPTSMVREPSLIQISEEKLKTLKHRARKLEDSLHDAISSMERINKSTQQSTGFSSNSNAPSPLDFLNSRTKYHTATQGSKTFRRWQKASFEISNTAPDKVIVNSGLTPRAAAPGKRSDSKSRTQDCKEKPVPDIRVALNSESSSLLEGRSIPSAPPDARDQTPASTSHRISSEKLTRHSSRSNFDDYTSDDERSRPDVDVIYTYRRQVDHHHHHHHNNNNHNNNHNHNGASTNSQQQSQAAKAKRLRARHNTSRMLGGKQTVSKCLRCQKLFSPTDNHKLACCYHTKDKERLEHYDQSGMLLRVMYAWKCCHEPQESEGCCFGQHV